MDTVKVIGSPLYQWEVGRKAQIFPSGRLKVSYVDFSHLGDTEALRVVPVEQDGVLVVDIPNILLQSDQNLVVYIVDVAEDKVETLRTCTLPVRKRAKPSDYVYTESEVLGYKTLESRIINLEKNGVSEEQIAAAVEKYLEENPIDSGVDFETDDTLKLENGILSVNTTMEMEQDNTLPITSAGVYATVGNIEALLKTI